MKIFLCLIIQNFFYCSDLWGCTSLVSAIFTERVDIVQALIQSGCDVNIASKGGFTPFKASLRHPPYMTQMLVLAGCNLGTEINVLLNVPEDNKLYDAYQDVRDWILNLVNNPKTLQQLCREAIRKQLPKQTHLKVRSLPIPQRLIEYLNLCDIKDIHDLYEKEIYQEEI